MAHRIAAIGECMIELSGQAGDLWRLGYAGDTFNVAWALRALTDTERPVDFVSAFGDDPFSQQQRAFLAQNQIGTSHSPIVPNVRPGLYAITLADAERSFTYWRSDSAAKRLAIDADLLAKSLEDRELIYFSGITLAILDQAGRKTLFKAIAEARSRGTHIAFDPNHRPSLWPDAETARDAVTEALRTSDMVLPTFADEQVLFGDATPDDTARRIEKAGAGEIVVKDGSGAATLLHYRDLHQIPAQDVPVPIDTTGAGDAFNGAYLAARLAGDPPMEAIARAHRVAAAVIRVRGALAPPQLLRIAFQKV